MFLDKSSLLTFTTYKDSYNWIIVIVIHLFVDVVFKVGGGGGVASKILIMLHHYKYI